MKVIGPLLLVLALVWILDYTHPVPVREEQP